MPVSIVFENFQSGATINEIMEWFDLTRDDIVTVLEFAARSVDPPRFQTAPVAGPLENAHSL